MDDDLLDDALKRIPEVVASVEANWNVPEREAKKTTRPFSWLWLRALVVIVAAWYAAALEKAAEKCVCVSSWSSLPCCLRMLAWLFLHLSIPCPTAYCGA